MSQMFQGNILKAIFSFYPYQPLVTYVYMTVGYDPSHQNSLNVNLFKYAIFAGA